MGAAVFPEAVWTLSGETLRRMGADYVAALRPLAPGADAHRRQDAGKFPLFGLIRLILPTARIIHVRRDPVDTCLSCFSKLFTGTQAFAYDLRELGRYYRGYQRLMAHWHDVLPPDILLEIEYEAVVERFRGAGAPDRRALRPALGPGVPGVPQEHASRTHCQHGPGAPADLSEFGWTMAPGRCSAAASDRGTRSGR